MVSADALHDAGAAAGLAGHLEEAEYAFRASLAARPNDARTRHALSLVLLGQGRYDEAWSLYEARFDVSELGMARPALSFPAWRGEPVNGKRLAIFPEQGLGDQIMYARFARLAVEHGADVTLLCAPALHRLFAQSLPVRVIAAAGSVDFPDPDYWTTSSSLAGRFGTTVETVPAAPYLSAPPRATNARIGIAWRGNPAFRNDANRSLSSDLGRRLLAFHGAISLAPEDTGAADFQDTAEIVAGLDLVITVDTAVAHLAGALGKPLWVLLPHYGQDWRWGRADRTPWYPQAQLFRQRPAETKADLVERVLHALG